MAFSTSNALLNKIVSYHSDFYSIIQSAVNNSVLLHINIPSNITVLSATSSSQVSGALKEKEHGLFTYYLLKGMSGKADENKDNSLDIKELSNYIIKEVKDQAALSGREQTPQIIGDNSKLLIQYWIVIPKNSR